MASSDSPLITAAAGRRPGRDRDRDEPRTDCRKGTWGANLWVCPAPGPGLRPPPRNAAAAAAPSRGRRCGRVPAAGRHGLEVLLSAISFVE